MGFNRTLVELKFIKKKEVVRGKARFNRTLVELKFGTVKKQGIIEEF